MPPLGGLAILGGRGCEAANQIENESLAVEVESYRLSLVAANSFPQRRKRGKPVLADEAPGKLGVLARPVAGGLRADQPLERP